MYSYYAYGLRITSPLAFPNLLERPDAIADVTIRFGRVNWPQNLSKRRTARFTAVHEKFFFFHPDVGTILVRDGREIVIDRAHDAEESNICAVVRVEALVALLHQRGLLIMHASAAEIDGGAVVFAANQGAGKSTLALVMHKMGHRFITDDICAIAVDYRVPVVFPSYPQVNVWPDALEALCYNPDVFAKVDQEEEKRAFPVRDGVQLEGVPLKAVYVIDRGETVCIQRLERRQAVSVLALLTIHDSQFGAVDDSAHFFKCVRLASAIDVRRLTLCGGLERLPKVIRAVEEDIRSHGV